MTPSPHIPPPDTSDDLESSPSVTSSPTTSLLSIDDRRWIDFIGSSTQATPFHHPGWARVISHTYGYKSLAAVRLDPTGRIVAGLPLMEIGKRSARRRWVALPFTDHLPPLAGDASELLPLIDGISVLQREAGIAQLQVRSELPGYPTGAAPVAVIHTLALDQDHDKLLRRFKRASVRKGIARARDNGLTVRHHDSVEDLTEHFYRLHLSTRRRLGVPVQPRRYFEHLWSEMIEPGRGFLLLAYYGDIPIAGAVFLAWNGTVTYKYGASDERYWNLHPNHLLMWTAICWGCENGFHTFDFGRSDFESKGLRQFKSGWTEERTLTYTNIGHSSPAADNPRLKAAVTAIVHHSPPWVCRLIGEAFYKYAA